MKYYSDIKRNELLRHAETCMALRTIMKNERSQREKTPYSQRIKNKTWSDFSSKKEERNEIFKVFREKAYQQNRILFPVKQFFKNEVEIKNFSDKQKLKKFVASNLLKVF